MDILAVNIGDASPTLAERLIDFLPINIKYKIRLYKQNDEQLRSLTGFMLAQVYAFESWGLSQKHFNPCHSRHGKPFLPGTPYYYNISHSGKWVVSAFEKNTEVGIDVEIIRPIDLEIADRFFSKSEVNRLNMLPEHQRISYFYKLWTLKESYIKAKGDGLSLSLNAFSFDIDNDLIEFKTSLDKEKWYFCQYDFGIDYEMAVCGHTREFPEQIEIIAWLDLAERFYRIVNG